MAVPSDPASVKPDSIRVVTFGGRNSITTPPGAPALSDPIVFYAAYGTEINVSLYVRKRVTAPTWLALALKRAVISSQGDHTRDERIQNATETRTSILVSAVLVPAQASKRLIVAFGDSIVDGDGSAMDADHNWSSDLIRLLGKTPKGFKTAGVNEGIAGNRLLGDGPLASLGVSALARFDRDALSVAGVTHIVLLEGINDLGFPRCKTWRPVASRQGGYADCRGPDRRISAIDFPDPRPGRQVDWFQVDTCEGVDAFHCY